VIRLCTKRESQKIVHKVNKVRGHSNIYPIIVGVIMGLRTGVSWKKAKEDAIKLKVRRAITMSSGDNPNGDIALKHPEWVREAQTGKYLELVKSVTGDIKRYQDRAIQRRLKISGKDQNQ